MANAGAAPVLGHQVGGVGHALHPPGDDHVGGAGGQGVVGQDGGLHAGAAHLVDGDRLHGIGQARAQGGLAGWRLAEAGGEHAAHDDLFHRLGVQARPFHGGPHGGRAKIGGLGGRQHPLETTHGRTGVGGDDDGISGGHAEFLEIPR